MGVATSSNDPGSGSNTGDPRWHATSVADTVASLHSDAERGLAGDQAKQRLATHGANELPQTPPRSLLRIFIAQFMSPLIYLLFGAAGIALAFGHVSDAIVIFVVVLLNALVGALQEGRAERSLQALRELTEHEARVVRDGAEAILHVREVVPGDVLVLEAGDAVAADARLLHGAALQASEAALTGESVPVAKHAGLLPQDSVLADRANIVHAGTYIAAGRGTAMVVSTGTDTEIGRIAHLAQSAESPPTPLERRIAQFGRSIMVAAAVMFVLIATVGWLRGLALAEVAMVAVSQVVGMIPEGLPVAMTIALAVGVRRMAARRAVVRRLSAVETLGSTTVICSDKTGTLTKNEMTVAQVRLPDGPRVDVTGTGYDPAGEFHIDGGAVEPDQQPALDTLLRAVLLCNDAQLLAPAPGERDFKPIGDPTEVALVTLALKGGLQPPEVRRNFVRRAELPFDSDTKMMATQHDAGESSWLVVKGAPEAVRRLCDFGGDEEAARRFDAMIDDMAGHALRVLAVATCEGMDIDGGAGFEPMAGRLRFAGLLGMIDPPRPEAGEAVLHCREAGMRPVMVTGDHKATGLAIAQTLGIARQGDLAVDGVELAALSDDDLASKLDRISVFARVQPAQKLRIVGAFQRRGEVAAMTGDGVNDAPALVKANVGVAMGRSGTEVAKEAADVVIGDDNFATIVAAIEEGRVVYRNIKKVVLYLFSTAMAEVSVLLLALLLGYPPPLAAVQILWINLVTESTVTVNLIMEPAEGDELQQKPFPPSEPLLTRLILSRIAFMTPAIAVSTLGWFMYRSAEGVEFARLQTETFTVLAVCQWFNALNCRSESRSAFSGNPLANPWLLGGLAIGNLLQVAVVFFRPLGDVFHTAPIGLREFALIGVVASLVLWVEELRKWVVRRRLAS